VGNEIDKWLGPLPPGRAVDLSRPQSPPPNTSLLWCGECGSKHWVPADTFKCRCPTCGIRHYACPSCRGFSRYVDELECSWVLCHRCGARTNLADGTFVPHAGGPIPPPPTMPGQSVYSKSRQEILSTPNSEPPSGGRPEKPPLSARLLAYPQYWASLVVPGWTPPYARDPSVVTAYHPTSAGWYNQRVYTGLGGAWIQVREDHMANVTWALLAMILIPPVGIPVVLGILTYKGIRKLWRTPIRTRTTRPIEPGGSGPSDSPAPWDDRTPW
jgi:hypothetical protein